MAKTLDDQGYGAARTELNDIAASRRQAVTDAELDALQLGIGAAGIFDPSPAADAANAGISLARGDYFGFVLDGVSALPYAGDLVAKPFRGIQMGIRAWARGRKLAGFARRGAALVDNIKSMRSRAAEAVREARKRLCVRCNNPYGTTTPTRGTWADAADLGNGKYTFNGNEYVFKEGYPDFEDPGMHKYLAQDGNPNAIPIEMTGKRDIDERLANAASGRNGTPDGYTWHHGDDGATMYLVEDTHHLAVVPHTGGHNIAQDPLF